MIKDTGSSYLQPRFVHDVTSPNQYAQYYSVRVRAADLDWIRRRRAHFGGGGNVGITAGLALSGGGARSATVCLGVLQALARRDKLRCFDFISSVSGGGYIAGCMTWLYHYLAEFPFGTTMMDARGRGGRVLAWLRRRAKYLIPGSGIGTAALLTALIGATVANLFVMVPLMLFLLTILDRPGIITREAFDDMSYFPDAISRYWNERAQELPASYGDYLSGFDMIFIAGWMFLVIFLVSTMIFAWTSGLRFLWDWIPQSRFRRFLAGVLSVGVGFILVGALPYIHSLVADPEAGLLAETVSGSSATGAASILFGRWQAARAASEGSSLALVRWAYGIGLFLLVIAIFLLLYHEVHAYGPGGMMLFEPLLYWLLLIGVFIGLFGNINYVSMHRYYRNRLMETYLPEQVVREELKSRNQGKPEEVDANSFSMSRLHPETGSPMLLVNTTASTVGSREPVLSQRGGINFVFSPRYHGMGSEDHRFAEDQTSNAYLRSTRMDLATAVAISGAAVNPNTYFTSSRPLSFLMSLLNLRLGYWFISPNYTSKLFPLFWHALMIKEMLGYGLHENSSVVHLSDGGHFENMGVYELLRRRCKYIVAIDAGMDSSSEFTDLARLIQLARVDFGIDIDIDISPLIPDEDSAQPTLPFAVGRINYAGYGSLRDRIEDEDKDVESDASDAPPREEPLDGYLLYVKSAMVNPENAEFRSYRLKHKSFPHETTMDQFFDEQQFEVYRELGYAMGCLIRGGESVDTSTRPQAHAEACRMLEEFWSSMQQEIPCQAANKSGR